MKSIGRIGLTIFYVGVSIFFIRQFWPNFISQISDSYINIMWPIGLILYGAASLYHPPANTES